MEYLEIEKGNAIATAKNYHHYLQIFAKFAHNNSNVETPAKISEELVKKFRLMLNRQNLSKSTQNYYLIALRSFLKYLSRNDIKTLDAGKIDLAKTQERQITFLEGKELDGLLAAPDAETLHGRRDRAILALLFSTGLRVSELCRLKKKDINLEKSEFSVRGKGGKIRVVFLDDASKDSLKKYLSPRRDKSEFLFISYGHSDKNPDSGKRIADSGMTPRSVQRLLKKSATKAGLVKKISPHTLRHSFATDLLIGGADLRSVQEMLGHASVNTTQIYTHLTNRQLQKVHANFHGRKNPPSTPASAEKVKKETKIDATDESPA